ncbi:MAG: DNA-binding response regulator [Actinobacteria bacterium HGW-Actinobacteria-5]|jgi:DNA-binding response OmpR family regulator|nr:MAG: DNA-binding response regulator [Actinobacteria bacterium HGW-Actinobacteria-5]
MKSVLVVDDDPTTREVLQRYLTRAGLSVLEAADGVTALEVFRTGQPDLVVLDLMLPGMDGLDVCDRLRRHSQVPIMMLTALGSESDRVVGLEQGADDYVVKPFSPREVTLRVQKLLERALPPGLGQRTLRDDNLVVDERSRTATLDGRDLDLTTREFDLLAFLLANPNQAFSRPELLERVWDWKFGDDSTVTVHVRRLRAKIEVNPSRPLRLQTVWGVGYRYQPVKP